MFIGRTIFYDLETGEILTDTNEKEGNALYRNPDFYISRYTTLSKRNPETFDYIELEYGEYQQDFQESNGYRINPETKEIEFSYPDPNEPEAPIVYQMPLSEQIEALDKETTLLKAQSEANATRADFQEEVITEIIFAMYG